MASEQHVKRYLAYWFQLGKKVVINNGESAVLPQPVITGDRYSDEFESAWQKITSPRSGDCYLEGTNQTIAELLTPKWNVEPCVRCDMPVPLINIGMPSELCPCNDLPTWPNQDIPKPRQPVSTQDRLKEIRDRLNKGSRHGDLHDDESTDSNLDSSVSHNGRSGQGRLSEIRDRLHDASQETYPQNG